MNLTSNKIKRTNNLREAHRMVLRRNFNFLCRFVVLECVINFIKLAGTAKMVGNPWWKYITHLIPRNCPSAHCGQNLAIIPSGFLIFICNADLPPAIFIGLELDHFLGH